MSRPYVHNPDIFKRHFIGKAMPYFKGHCIQRGNSEMFSIIKRLAVPLLSAAAPHIAGAASSLARKAVKKVFPKHKKLQQVVGDVVRAGASTAVGELQKRKISKSAPVRAKRRKNQTSSARSFSNIFDD